MSLRAVAQQAGVSVSTVSRYLRGELRLKDETEYRVIQAMQELNYEPQTENSSTNTVALIVPDLKNPYFADIAETVSKMAVAHGGEAVIQLTNGIRSREQGLVLNALENPAYQAIFYVGTNRHNPVLETAVGRKPLVVLDEPMAKSAAKDIPFVGADNFSGAFQATAYLISLGHQKIAHVGGPKNSQSAKERHKGYKSALKVHGIAYDESLIFRGPYTEKFGASVLSYLTQIDPMPTALMVASDIVAIGIISSVETNGLRIPQDLSVVGFDGIGSGTWIHPQLTTVVQPIEEIVETGFAELVRLRDKETAHSHRLPMELQVRESTAPLT
ncbi:LacI family DNA-binding transcriptional regulator [Corynebacterium caspium]|uniref:LacI family DNA-binding transcriptional regulator n=1 Tax=Corynebacterium caspium TaxID=234828 RepID=UPI0003774D3D|nr:LacI family DNA-binding transcriptional regulator [Corynebacterium caspium]WKD58462.1 Catabolite control protein A [Corynebacterium caspium DSM 44850]